MRKIPRVVEKKIFRLWLEGCPYREIGPKCGGVSLATISKVINSVRKRETDIDTLRQLNIVLKKDDRSVYDAIRGGILLDRVNELGVNLDDLEDYVKTVERISSEKEAEAKKFVDSAMELIRLEKETGKPYGAVITDFEEKRSKVGELEQTRTQLERRIAQLHQEGDKVKQAFEAQGLGWAGSWMDDRATPLVRGMR